MQTMQAFYEKLPFFGVVLYAGGLATNAPAETSQKLEQFGYLYGEVIQIDEGSAPMPEAPVAQCRAA